MYLAVVLPVRKIHGIRKCSTMYSVNNLLCEENIKRTAAKLKSSKPIRFQAHEPAKRAAVLVPLCVVDHEVSLLYTLRAPHLKSHRGQVSFPGGMQENNDRDLIHTALRETEEELGIPETDIKIWGPGNLIITRSDMCVLPVLGQIEPSLSLNKLKINREEVEEVFTVSLEKLCDPEKLRYTQFRGQFSAPVFLAGPRRIWGLTALITNVFLSCLLPPQAYTHQVRHLPNVKSLINLTVEL